MTIANGTRVSVHNDYHVRDGREGVIVARTPHSLYLIDFGPAFRGHNGNNVPLEQGKPNDNFNQWFVHADFVTALPTPIAPEGNSKVQNDAVLNHLLAGNSLTPLEAIGVFRIFRLAARIHELKKKGHKIVTTMKRDASGKQYAEYALVSRNMRAA